MESAKSRGFTLEAKGSNGNEVLGIKLRNPIKRVQNTASFLYTAFSSVNFLSDSSDIHQLCTHPSVLRWKPVQEICLYMPAEAMKLTEKELQVW